MQQRNYIIGLGKLGKTWHALAEQQQLQLTRLHSDEALNSPQTAHIVFIATPDAAIADFTSQLAQAGWRANYVVHFSGALDSSEICPTLTAHRFSVHPIHSFAHTEHSLQNFKGTSCLIEGDSSAGEIEHFIKTIGGTPITIANIDKHLYHAATVMSSNYLVSLMSIALNTFSKAGMDDATARQLITPLSRQTLENVLTIGPKHALTGPIARGDISTLEKHLAALENTDEITLAAYKVLGTAAAKLCDEDRSDITKRLKHT